MYKMMIDDNKIILSGATNRIIVLNDNLYEYISKYFREFGYIDLYKKVNFKNGMAYTNKRMPAYINEYGSDRRLILIVEKSYLGIVREALRNEGFVKKEEGFRRQLKR